MIKPNRRFTRIIALALSGVTVWFLLRTFVGQDSPWLFPAGFSRIEPTAAGSHAPSIGPGREQQAVALNYNASQVDREYCAAHGYQAFAPAADGPRRKVYDLFMVNSELDFLELRLDTLFDYVDYFIIAESLYSFQGYPKNLTIRDNWHTFERYHSKMIYHLVEYPRTFRPKYTWDYEDLQRDSMYTQVFPKLSGELAPTLGDVIIVADVDEIPRPETLQVLRACKFPRRLTLFSKFYYYSFQFLHVGPEWRHPQATFYDGDNTITPSNLRSGDGGTPLLNNWERGALMNAGWHCSSCFATIDQFLNKLSSFSHIWMNDAKYRDRDKIADAVRLGKDLWGRRTETFRRIDGNKDMPSLLLKDERYAYMVSRDGPSAGFTDYP